MHDVVLLVGHGSRDVAGNDEIKKFTQLWREQQPGWDIELCFIEFADVTLACGLACAAAQARAKARTQTGPARVLVLPLILNAAGHVKMDIPAAIAHAREHHPDVRFYYAPHLGVNKTMLQILRRRLRLAMLQLDAPDPHNTGVIVLGRGSSDRQANSEMARLTRWLFEVSEHELVDLAFTGVAWPRLEKVVQRHSQLGMRQIVILPYYLYTGTLMTRIARQTEHLRQQYPHIRFVHTLHFGFEPEIFMLLNARVQGLQDLHTQPADSWRMPCDGCDARAKAAAAGAFHHHDSDAHPQHAHAHAHAHEHEHTHGSYPPRYQPHDGGDVQPGLAWQTLCESCKYHAFAAQHAAV